MKATSAHSATADATFPVPRAARVPGARRRALARVLAEALATVRRWRRRAYERRLLAGLDERMLQDIGIDRARASHEAAKPFWRR